MSEIQSVVPAFDARSRYYTSGRSMVFGKNGMVCASQPLAVQAGIEIMKKGGNAIDAAVAVAACMPVLEPVSNDVGSDAFAIVWTKGELIGLNASGRAPMGITAQAVREQGFEEMPKRGWIPVMVPGAPSAWAALNKRFGKLPLTEVMAPAIRYAREGYPVQTVTSIIWEDTWNELSKKTEPCHKAWKEMFSVGDHAPRPGEIWKNEELAQTLEKIAQTDAEAFYRGELADAIDAFSRETGGYIRKSDLETYEPAWVTPIHTNYRGYDVCEIPPNGIGIIALMTLNLLQGFAFSERDTVETMHRQIESMKLCYVDGKRYVADPKAMKVTVDELLSMDYAKTRRDLIGEKALEPMPGDPKCGGTVYFCAADGEGNMISYIQSNYNNFGSGIVIPGTGIELQDRGANFSLDENMENCLAPGKKSFHTIIPGFLMKDGKPVGPFGVMGGFMQPQGHVQVMANTLDFHMNPQQALDAPRWQWVGGKKIQIEKTMPKEIVEGLIARGHEIEVMESSIKMGRGQIIWRREDGVLCGATEPRADGIVGAF